MDQSPSSEVNSSSCGQEIPGILWNSKVHHRAHKSPQRVSLLSKMNPVYDHLTDHFNITLLSTIRKFGP